MWAKKIRELWVISTIRYGHGWKFIKQPSRAFVSTKMPSVKEKQDVLWKYINTLLEQEAIVAVP